MSSPLASLGKTRRVPLQSESVNSGRRSLKIYGDEDEVDMLNEGPDSEEKISVPSCYGHIGAPVSRQVPESYNSDHMATLMKNLRDLERQVKSQTDEILIKDQKIQALEELVQNLQENQGKRFSLQLIGPPASSPGPVTPGYQDFMNIDLNPMVGSLQLCPESGSDTPRTVPSWS